MADEGPSVGDVEAAQGASAGQLLLRAARLLDESALKRIRALPGAPGVRPAHTRLFPYIRHEGIRATEIAERLGVTKQAVGPLVADLETWGLVELVPDPTDGRARLIRWTSRGRAGLIHGLTVLGELEAALAERVGPASVDALRDTLRALVDLLEEEAAP